MGPSDKQVVECEFGENRRVYQGWNGGEVEEVPRTTLRVAQVPH